MSEYDPVLSGGDPGDQQDLDLVRDAFTEASRPFVSSPWTWLVWAFVLPAAALATPLAADRFGLPGVVFLWPAAVLVGGVFEAVQIRRRRTGKRSGLARWVLRTQGNLSLVAVLLSIALIWEREAALLPALWLLLIGHNLSRIGGLASPGLAACGRIYQLGGIVALWPGGPALRVFALAAGLGNLWAAWSLWRDRRAR